MKNFTILSLICIMSANTAFSQNFFEDFESGLMPENFILINNDGLIPALPGDAGFADTAWMVSTSTTFEGHAAISISWYEDANGNEVGPADDWMILPKLDISANSMLHFKVRSATSSGNFRDDYQVLINAGEPTVESFDAQGFLLLAEQQVVHNAWAERSIDLSEYAGQSMHIAFRNVTNTNGYGLWINDIEVTNVTSNNNPKIDLLATRIEIFPNPVKLNALLDIELLNKFPVKLKLSDINGRILNTFDEGILPAGTHQLSIPMDQYPAGVYLLRVIIDEISVGRMLVKE